ncbi:MAG: epoxyqueuosine reductase QueH [Clostridiales bacterium]|nr:epoxyqueuosine reductase QueH [Clostridiales bacterium]
MSGKDVLLHACCAPCAEYPVFDLMGQDIATEVLYFNPNIHPKFEFERRREQLVKLSSIDGFTCHFSDAFRIDDWLSHKWEGQYASRCLMCYDIRMDHVAKFAKENGYQRFSTSLLVSPYQNHEAIIASAERASEKYGIPFFYVDWRPHFREGQNMAREHGLYRQKYCGCIFSLDDSEFKEKIIASFPENWEAQR